ANELDVVELRPDSQHARDDLIPERVLGAHHQFDLVFTGLVPEARPPALPDRRLQLPLGPGGAPIEQQDEVPAEEALAVGAFPVPALTMKRPSAATSGDGMSGRMPQQSSSRLPSVITAEPSQAIASRTVPKLPLRVARRVRPVRTTPVSESHHLVTVPRRRGVRR